MSTTAVKKYLSQARYLDMRIASKIQQITSLNELATKCTATLTGMPRTPSYGTSTMADAIVKIVDLQTEINGDIEKLVDLKKEITGVIKSVSNPEYQTILEKRYLCFLSWEQISVDMNYSMQYTFRMHDRALAEADASLKVESQVD